MKRLRVCLALGALLPTVAVFAAEGRIEIYQPVSVAGGSGGKYFLSRNVMSTGVPAIEIIGTGGQEIDIDLNGFTASRTDVGKVISVDNVRSFTLRNGSVLCASGSTFAMTVGGPPSANKKAIIEDLKIENCGIELVGRTEFVVRRNLIVQSGGDGIYVNNVNALKSTGTIEDNTVRAAKGVGIHLDVTSSPAFLGVTIRANRVSTEAPGGAEGILVMDTDSSLIADNDVFDTVSDGIKLIGSTGARLVNNRIRNAGDNGIELTATHHCLITENVSYQNANDGIALIASDRNHIDRNVTNNNARYGLFLEAITLENHYGRNSATGNLGAPAGCPPVGAGCVPPDLCDMNPPPGSQNRTFGDNLMPGPC